MEGASASPSLLSTSRPICWPPKKLLVKTNTKHKCTCEGLSKCFHSRVPSRFLHVQLLKIMNAVVCKKKKGFRYFWAATWSSMLFSLFLFCTFQKFNFVHIFFLSDPKKGDFNSWNISICTIDLYSVQQKKKKLKFPTDIFLFEIQHIHVDKTVIQMFCSAVTSWEPKHLRSW